MNNLPNEIAIAASPWQIVIVVVATILLFAPQLLKPAGRILGRLAGRELKRRIGLPIRPLRVQDITLTIDDAMKPSTPTVEPELGVPQSAAPTIETARSWNRIAAVSGFSLLFILVLWLILHQR